jgi:hypothetical protein
MGQYQTNAFDATFFAKTASVAYSADKNMRCATQESTSSQSSNDELRYAADPCRCF